MPLDTGPFRLQRALLLHSGFRTGSTWFWHCFRRAGAHAYYEPFHGRLASLTAEAIDGMWPGKGAPAAAAIEQIALGHPAMTAPPFDEYRSLLAERGGVLRYQPRFAYDDYFEAGPNDAQACYVRLLVNYARGIGKVPVLGFCRSLSRVGWFREADDGINVVTWRNPLDQWASYRTQTLKYANPYFEFRSFHLAALASRHPRVAAHFEDLGLPSLGRGALSRTMAGQALALMPHFEAADPARRFRIFLRLFLVDMLHALRHADLIVDLDRMTVDAAYRDEATETLRRLSGLADLDFSNCALTRHPPRDDIPYAEILAEAADLLALQPAGVARSFVERALADATGRATKAAA